jgi:hypothetical protein
MLVTKLSGIEFKLKNLHRQFPFSSCSLRRTMSHQYSPVIPLSAIPTLSDLYKSSNLQAPSPDLSNPPASTALNSKISLIQTSITSLAVTCIVNAANSALRGGAGVVRVSSLDLLALSRCHPKQSKNSKFKTN